MNKELFINRITHLMEINKLTAASFAKNIGVPKSSISHIMSGRNKPSLDFIIKIVSAYPDADLKWLIFGEGNYGSKSISDISPAPSLDDTQNASIQTTMNLKPQNEPHKNITAIPESKFPNQIERIVIFFKNGKFKEYIS